MPFFLSLDAANFLMFRPKPLKPGLRRRRSSWFLMSFVVCLLLLCGCAGEPKHPTWKNASGAEQHERLMWKAIQDHDWTQVERHVAPLFVGVTADGQSFDRAGWIEYWKSAPVEDFSLAEVAVEPGGSDMVVTYVLRLTGTRLPHSLASVRVISIWQDLKGRWVLIATAGTPISQ